MCKSFFFEVSGKIFSHGDIQVYLFSNFQKAIGAFLSQYAIFGGFKTNIQFFCTEARNQLGEKLNWSP